MRNVLLVLISIICFLYNPAFAATPAPKTWTFLIFLNGDNSLDDFGRQNILDMEKVGSNDQVNVVVQWASASKGKAVRMLIQKSSNPLWITSPVVEDLGRVDMGDYKSLENFIAWGVKNYPAEHYFVDVWDHGSGWHKEKLPHYKLDAIHPLDISWDDFSGHAITTKQLGQVMNDSAKVIGHKIDIYGSDACLMAMAEVANEMSDSVAYYAGSQETEPGKGWPYADLLSRWEAQPNATALQVSSILVDAYVKSYENGSNGRDEVTFSAYDLTKLADLNKSIAALSSNFLSLSSASKSKVAKAIQSVLEFPKYESGDYGDLLDFMDELNQAKISGLDETIIANVKSAAQRFIIADEDTPGYRNAKGLSVWLPQELYQYKSYIDLYHTMEFDKATKWGDALGEVIKS